VWSLDDPLDLGDLVTGSKQEVRADGTDLFVLLERGGNSFGAGGIGAFADELGVAGAESPGALGDSLVHVSEQRFGARNPHFSFGHLVSRRIDWQFNNGGRRELVAPTLETCGLMR